MNSEIKLVQSIIIFTKIQPSEEKQVFTSFLLPMFISDARLAIFRNEWIGWIFLNVYIRIFATIYIGQQGKAKNAKLWIPSVFGLPAPNQ